MEKKITIEITSLVAKCLQRMIVDEIENQEWWKSEDNAVGVKNDFRDEIISQMKELVEQLERKGINRYSKC